MKKLILFGLLLSALVACHKSAQPQPGPHLFGLPSGGAQPVCLTDSTGAFCDSIVDAGGGLYGLKVSGLSAATGAVAPGTPAYNPSWYAATDIYWDPSGAASTGAGLDSNNCTALATPCLTIAEIWRRYGSHYPTLNPNQVQTWHVLTGQSLAQGETDPVGNIGVTAPGNGAFVIIGTFQPVGTTFAAGAVTQVSRANPGNDFQVNIAASSGAAAGQLIFDSTVANGSYCWIESIASNVATCTAPHRGTGGLTTPSAVYTTTQNGSSWATSDTLQLYTVPTIYAESYEPTAGLVSNTSTEGYAWVQGVNFGELYNVTGVSVVTWKSKGRAVFSLVRADAFVALDGSSSPGFSFVYPTMASVWLNGAARVTGSATFYGGAIATTNGDGNSTTIDNQPVFQHDTILHGNVFLYGYEKIYNVHAAASSVITCGSPSGVTLLAGTANGSLWGAGTIRVSEFASLINRTGGTWANNVIVGALQLTASGLTTGCALLGGWQCGLTVSSANLDIYGAMSDPESFAVLTNAAGTQVSQTQQTIACSTGGTFNVAANPTPQIIVTSGTLSSNCVIAAATNASTGCFDYDMSGVSFGATFGVQWTNGSATSTVYTTANVVTGDKLARVCTHGTNTLAVSF